MKGEIFLAITAQKSSFHHYSLKFLILNLNLKCLLSYCDHLKQAILKSQSVIEES